MKDMYRRLQADGPHQPFEVEQAIRQSRGTSDDLLVAGLIFGSTRRRQEYDHAWRTLSLIAMFRKRLGLDRSPLWMAARVDDFRLLNIDAPRAAWCLPYDGFRPADDLSSGFGDSIFSGPALPER